MDLLQAETKVSQSELQLPSQPIPQPSSSSSPIPSPSPSASTKPDITQDFKDLKSFLSRIGMEKHLSLFEEQEIELEQFPQWTYETLKNTLGLKIGPAKAIAEALKPYQ